MNAGGIDVRVTPYGEVSIEGCYCFVEISPALARALATNELLRSALLRSAEEAERAVASRNKDRQ